MSKILEYYKTDLANFCSYEDLQFEVEGEPNHSFNQLKERLDKNGGSFLFNPVPLFGEKKLEEFSLLQIEKVPANKLLPGLLLEHDAQKFLLIHDRYTSDKQDGFREELKLKLRKLGCRPMAVTRISSVAKILNPDRLADQEGDLWLKHRNFRFFEDLEKLPIGENDLNAVINQKTRFLCRGGSLLIVAPSGVGKSTLLMQMAISWSAGRDFFGLKPVRDLRCFLLQGENDDGDVAEMAHGIKMGLRLKGKEPALLHKNFAMQSSFGMPDKIDFAGLLKDLIELHKPEVFFVDPLFAFLQGDFNSQEFGSENFRQRIDPVLKKSGCILVSTHHTPKPARETPRTGGVDFSYSGFGTSELTNWHRAVATLRPEKGLRKTFRFIVAKRGARAGFPGGLNYCLMRHSEAGLFWERVASVVLAPPDGTASKDEHEALRLLAKIKPDQPETRDEILARIMRVKGIQYRHAGNYWAQVKKYFAKVGGKYIFVPPDEKQAPEPKPETSKSWVTPPKNRPRLAGNKKLKPKHHGNSIQRKPAKVQAGKKVSILAARKRPRRKSA